MDDNPGRLELLEDICASYADDEDRFLEGRGEPYGSIPTEAGIQARHARLRSWSREAASARAKAMSEGLTQAELELADTAVPPGHAVLHYILIENEGDQPGGLVRIHPLDGKGRSRVIDLGTGLEP